MEKKEKAAKTEAIEIDRSLKGNGILHLNFSRGKIVENFT
jgi:hypothetical protein